MPAEVGASTRCLVYWLLPSFFTRFPGAAPFLWESFSGATEEAGGLSGCEDGGGEARVVGLDVSLGSSSASEVSRHVISGLA